MTEFFDSDCNTGIPSGLYAFEEIFVGTINDERIHYVDNKQQKPKQILVRNDQDEWMSSQCFLHDSGKWVRDSKHMDIVYLMLNIQVRYQITIDTKIEMETKTGINRHNIEHPRNLEHVVVVQAKCHEDTF